MYNGNNGNAYIYIYMYVWQYMTLYDNIWQFVITCDNMTIYDMINKYYIYTHINDMPSNMAEHQQLYA